MGTPRETGETITLTPDYAGMRDWLKNVARTDLPAAVRINDSLGSEGVDWTELADIADPERAS